MTTQRRKMMENRFFTYIFRRMLTCLLYRYCIVLCERVYGRACLFHLHILRTMHPATASNWLNIFNIRYSSSWNRHLHAFDTYNTMAKYMLGINTKKYGFVIHAFALLLLRLSLLSQSYWVRMRIETHMQTQPSRCDDDIGIAKNKAWTKGGNEKKLLSR